MSVPGWLRQRLAASGGAVPFRTYMDWVLHDPEHGAYGSGRLRIGPAGDFATAPSLGPDFATLLAVQVASWLQQLDGQPSCDSTATGSADPTGPGAADDPAPRPLALVEAGPGEGSLAADLAAALARGWPQLAARTELVLVEPNGGMAARQRRRLAGCPLPCRWSSFEQLAARPVRGVLLAHEVLDALAVERIEWDGATWRQQRVVLHEVAPAGPSLRLEPGEPLPPASDAALQALGLLPPSPQRPPGWCSELHPGLEPWLAAAAGCFSSAALLVIDYALEAWRYYAPQRSGGTLLAYRAQAASADPLRDPGQADLTAHLCIDSLEAAAATSGWQSLGGCRQGEALLALGLAQRLHGLQHDPAGLAELLPRREALLRLVDPHALGDFRWLAYGRGLALPVPRFLQDPAPPTAESPS